MLLEAAIATQNTNLGCGGGPGVGTASLEGARTLATLPLVVRKEQLGGRCGTPGEGGGGVSLCFQRLRFGEAKA